MLLNDFDVIINVGDADTAQSGGGSKADPKILTAVRKFVSIIMRRIHYNWATSIRQLAGKILPAG